MAMIKNAIIYAESGGGGGTYSKVVRQLTSSGTWTKPTGLTHIEVICIGGGGAGASGSVRASGREPVGGGAGAAACISWASFLAADLASTEDYYVGSGGIGGESITTNSTQGISGGEGGNSMFGGNDFATSKVFAQGGRNGLWPGSGGGDRLSTNQKPSSCIVGLAGGSRRGGAASWSATPQNTSINFNNFYGGSAGGGANIDLTVAYGSGSAARYYNKSGTLSSANGKGVNENGADGENNYMDRLPYLGNEGHYVDITAAYGTPGSGGGGSITGNGGNGGNGGNYGGAGGGGGGAKDDVGNSGRGGNGGAGVIIIIEHIVS